MTFNLLRKLLKTSNVLLLCILMSLSSGGCVQTHPLMEKAQPSAFISNAPQVTGAAFTNKPLAERKISVLGVAAENAGSKVSGGTKTVCDKLGKFILNGLAGRVVLYARSESGNMAAFKEASGEAFPRNVTIDLAPAATAIGSVKPPEGVPIGDVRMLWTAIPIDAEKNQLCEWTICEVSLDKDGKFELAGIPTCKWYREPYIFSFSSKSGNGSFGTLPFSACASGDINYGTIVLSTKEEPKQSVSQTGELKLSQHLPLSLKIEESNVRCEWIEFQRTETGLKADLCTPYVDAPSRWIVWKVQLFDSDHKEISSAAGSVHTMSFVETVPWEASSHLMIDLPCPAGSVEKAKSFKITLEVSHSEPTGVILKNTHMESGVSSEAQSKWDEITKHQLPEK